MKKNKWLLIIVISLLEILIVIGGGFSIWKLYETSNLNINNPINVVVKKLQPIQEPTITTRPIINYEHDCLELNKNINITSINEKWALYTNKDKLFSIKLPMRAEISGTVYGCLTIDDSDNNKINITTNWNGKITAEGRIGTISAPNWKLIIKRNISESQINLYINEQFNYSYYGCKVKEKILKNDGSYEIIINKTSEEELLNIQKNNTLSTEEKMKLTCFIDNDYVMRYSPKKQTIVYWEIDKNNRFFKSIYPLESYDKEIVDSFTFLE